MMVSLLLSLCRPNFEISTPSMRIRPLAGSISLLKRIQILIKSVSRSMCLKRARVSDDFPAPVRPTMPTLSPPWR